MYLPEEALQKLTKDKLVNLLLEYQNKFTLTLDRIESDIGNLRKNYSSTIIYKIFETNSSFHLK